MIGTLAAERIKLARRRVTWFTVWIFPVGTALILLAALAWELVRGGPPDANTETAAQWMGESTLFWTAGASPPARFLLGAFVAAAFGSEYGWNTWKLIVPHRSRTELIAAKYLTVLGLIAVSLVLMNVVAVAILFAGSALLNEPVPAGVSAAGLLAAHGRAALGASLAVLLTVAYAGAGAVLARSTLAGVIIAVVAVTAEGLLQQFAILLEPWLVQALPAYHLQNLGRWIDDGEALAQPFKDGSVVRLGWGASLAVYAAWVGGLIALSFVAFRRQDLN